MNKTIARYIIIYLALVLAQAIVFNNLVLFGCAVPLVFIYLVISLPPSLGTNASMTIGFVTGLIVDAFADTYGMNALCCTILAFVRKPVLHLYVDRDEDVAGQPLNVRTMGWATFMKYALTMTLIYTTLYFITEAFNFFSIQRLLLRIAASTAYTFVLICALSSLSISRREKKL